MAVYAVKYSPFVPNIFLSASADWTLKLWHDECVQPIMSFDLNNSIGDVAWSPYSSTTFAAVTAEGKVFYCIRCWFIYNNRSLSMISAKTNTKPCAISSSPKKVV